MGYFCEQFLLYTKGRLVLVSVCIEKYSKEKVLFSFRPVLISSCVNRNTSIRDQSHTEI